MPCSLHHRVNCYGCTTSQLKVCRHSATLHCPPQRRKSLISQLPGCNWRLSRSWWNTPLILIKSQYLGRRMNLQAKSIKGWHQTWQGQRGTIRINLTFYSLTFSTTLTNRRKGERHYTDPTHPPKGGETIAQEALAPANLEQNFPALVLLWVANRSTSLYPHCSKMGAR